MTLSPFGDTSLTEEPPKSLCPPKLSISTESLETLKKDADFWWYYVLRNLLICFREKDGKVLRMASPLTSLEGLIDIVHLNIKLDEYMDEPFCLSINTEKYSLTAS